MLKAFILTVHIAITIIRKQPQSTRYLMELKGISCTLACLSSHPPPSRDPSWAMVARSQMHLATRNPHGSSPAALSTGSLCSLQPRPTSRHLDRDMGPGQGWRWELHKWVFSHGHDVGLDSFRPWAPGLFGELIYAAPTVMGFWCYPEIYFQLNGSKYDELSL